MAIRATNRVEHFSSSPRGRRNPPPLGPLQLSFAFPLVKKSFDETEFFRLSLGTRF